MSRQCHDVCDNHTQSGGTYDPADRQKIKYLDRERCQLPSTSFLVLIEYETQPQGPELIRIAKAIEEMEAKIGRRHQRLQEFDDVIRTSRAINIDKLIVEHATLQVEREKLGGGRGSRGEPFRAAKRKVRWRLDAITRDLAAAVPATIEGHVQDRARTAESLARRCKDLAKLQAQGRALERTLPPSVQRQFFGADA